MKKLKGMSLLLALVLLGVLISVIGGTIAYIVTKSTPIVNTFQLGEITYELKLYPNKPDKASGEVVMPTVTPDGGVGTGSDTAAAGSVTFTLSDVPKLTGWQFSGWAYKSQDTTGHISYDTDHKNIEVAYNANYPKNYPTITDKNTVSLELYALWEPITYTVKYNHGVEGGTGITGSTTDSSHTYDEAKNLTKNGYVRQGYTFNGWKDENGNSYKDEESVINLTTVPNGTVTLTAQWDAKSYIIRYHANGGTGSMADQTIKYDVPTQLKENAFTKSDYSFMGWALSETGEVKYIDKQEVVNLLESGTLDLYAVWAQDTHTVTFDYNGGTGSPASKQFQNGKAYGQLPEYPVHPTTPISETEIMSYLFTGWYTEPTGGTRVYPTDIANRTDDHTLYAHWEEAPTNNVIKDIVVKNNPDDNKDGVVDDIYINLKCSSSFEKYNIPLENLVVGQTYKLTYTTSNDASFGDYITGYQNSVYGSYIVQTKELTGGRIDATNSNIAYYGKDLLATWNNRIEPDGVNDGNQKATNDAYLQGPWKNRTITFTAQASTMYWVWDFGLIEDGIPYDFNITDIVLEPVVPEIKFNEKQVIKGTSSVAKITLQTNGEYSSTFIFDGDGGCETVYYPITGLTAGTTYTITFAHTFSGPLIHDTNNNSNPTYEYGCGIMNEKPTKTGDKMTALGTWASGTFVKKTVDGNVDSVTLTFKATGDTAYWVWNMANCSDSTDCTTKIEVTTFSAQHSGGGSITYYSAAPTLSVEEIADVLESPGEVTETEEIPVETEEILVETEELPVETEELPVETEELPVETEEIPVETEELPVETEELPLELETFTAEMENPVLGGGEIPADAEKGGA